MGVELPEPGTMADLLRDAAAAGWAAAERSLRDWTTKGLLASPRRRSLGRGHGQAPGLYSSKQRALFGWLAAYRARGAHNERLAAGVIYTWLYHEDDWVDDRQALAALHTAIGNPKKSRRVAAHTAKVLVRNIDFGGAPAAARRRLREELQTQLQRGRIDPTRLRPRVAAVLDVPGIEVVRGPGGAQLSTEVMVDLLTTRQGGASALATATVAEMAAARHAHRVTWAQFSMDRSDLYQAAASDMLHLFAESTGRQLLDGAVPGVLYHLGVLNRPNALSKDRSS